VENSIVSEIDFINSFGKFQSNQARKYLEAKELFKYIKNMSEISRILRVPNRTVNEWLCGTKTPVCIKQMNLLKKLNLLPLIISNNSEFFLFLDIFAFVFGDGHLNADLGSIRLCGCKEDLKIIQKKAKEIFGIGCKIQTILASTFFR